MLYDSFNPICHRWLQNSNDVVSRKVTGICWVIYQLVLLVHWKLFRDYFFGNSMRRILIFVVYYVDNSYSILVYIFSNRPNSTCKMIV